MARRTITDHARARPSSSLPNTAPPQCYSRRAGVHRPPNGRHERHRPTQPNLGPDAQSEDTSPVPNPSTRVKFGVTTQPLDLGGLASGRAASPITQRAHSNPVPSTKETALGERSLGAVFMVFTNGLVDVRPADPR